jgi:hypothetical protein
VTALPEEMLWTILGYLDLRTLCTARIVCKRFRHVGAGNFKTLQLDCAGLRQNPKTDFTHFSGLTHLCVSLESDSSLPLLTQPGIAPLVTHVRLNQTSPGDQRHAGGLALLALLPKLRSLSIPGDFGHVIRFVPAGLEELILPTPIRRDADASALTRLSGLTSLVFHGNLHAAASPSLGLDKKPPLQAASNVPSNHGQGNQRPHQLTTFPSPSDVLSTFTKLRSLIWFVSSSSGGGTGFHGLGQLTGLSQLKVSSPGEVGLEFMANIASLSGLTSLDLSGCTLAWEAGASSALAPLTRLVSLGLFTGPRAMSFLPSLNIEALHSLTLSHSGIVCRSTWVLHRATGLTHLALAHRLGQFPYWLDVALAKMSGLRSLDLRLSGEDPGTALAHITDDPWHAFHLSRVLQGLTRLTKLKYAGPFTANRDIEACVSLPSLRDLEFHSMQRVTLACLPALQAMSGLTKLTLRHSLIHQVDLTPKVRAAFDAPRLLRGWPPLKIECGWT